jgi:ABC-type uncharacterized transport system permease subunit
MSGLRHRLAPLAIPVLAVLSAFIVGSIFLMVTDLEAMARLGSDPLGAFGDAAGSVVAAYQALLMGAFGDPAKVSAAIADPTPRKLAAAIRPLTETLVASTPLIFTGLAVAISFRTSVFNIGVEGQFVLGALGATIAALILRDLAPAPVILVVALVAGMATGGLWGFVPGFLKARTGAHEVITTIMLNYVAAQVVLFALRSDFLRQEGSGQPISKVIKEFAQIPLLVPLPGMRLHLGFIVALIVAAIVSWFLFRTTKGFELRAAGFSLTAARYAGMSAGGSIILAMSIAGAVAGLGGAFQVLGTVGQMSNDVSSGFGWDAIALALLGGIRPGGVVAAALLFGALRTGGGLMQVKTGIPLDLLFFIQALVIMFVAAPGLVRRIYRLRQASPQGAAPAQEGAAA